MTKELVIQKVDAQNFDDFLGLIDKLAEFEELSPPDLEAKNRLRRDCLSDKPKFEAYIGKIRDTPVSYVAYFFTYSTFLALPTLFLEDIFVLKEHRQQGVGEELFAFVKEKAKQKGCGRLELAVLKWNTVAQEFYEKYKAKRLEWFMYRLTKEEF
ncbi:MAG: GNAT family N-acetyltransferase [Candidatus Bathyarchaeota archaeon]|nr:GNAT family N-acetyltransferase [Candidatus Bathyarchaeota archaeon]